MLDLSEQNHKTSGNSRSCICAPGLNPANLHAGAGKCSQSALCPSAGWCADEHIFGSACLLCTSMALLRRLLLLLLPPQLPQQLLLLLKLLLQLLLLLLLLPLLRLRLLLLLLLLSLLSANVCGRRPGNKSSAGFSRRFPEGVKGVKPRCRPLGGFTKLGELVLPPGQTTAFGVTLNPGHKWLDLQPGDPSALLPQLCKAGTTSAAASPPAPKPECHCGPKRHWHPEATGQPTQQNARSGKTAAAWVSPQPGSPLRPLDAATGSGPGFELGFAEVADRDHSPLMPNLQRMEGGIP